MTSFVHTETEQIVNVLVADDDFIQRKTLKKNLGLYLTNVKIQHSIISKKSPQEVMNFLSQYAIHGEELSFAIVDHDFDGDDINGIDLIGEIKKISPSTICFLITQNFRPHFIEGCCKVQADEIFSKIEGMDRLYATIMSFLQKKELLRKIMADNDKNNSCSFVGKTMQEIYLRIPKILDSAIRNIHIYGATGTGKEIVAQLFKQEIKRRFPRAPFIEFNAATLSNNILMSELFGHKKGAYTGAIADHRGLLEAANGGWLFIDEVQELTLEAQAALLRFMECGRFRPLGAEEEKTIQVRFLSASNVLLLSKIKLGSFRDDFYHRLSDANITLPPLAERKDEIPQIIELTLREMNRDLDANYSLTNEVHHYLCTLPWKKGNVRELKSCIRAMSEKAVAQQLGFGSLPENIKISIAEKKILPAKEGIYLDWKPRREESDSCQIKNFEHLSLEMLSQMLRIIYQQEKKSFSLCDLAEIIGLSKSTLDNKLKNLVKYNYFSIKEAQEICNKQFS